jgi:hypothetical protein
MDAGGKQSSEGSFYLEIIRAVKFEVGLRLDASDAPLARD